MGWDKTGRLLPDRASIPLLGATSKLILFGHSLTGHGGASSPDRGFLSIISASLRSQDVHNGRGGAVLGWAETTFADMWSNTPYPIANTVGDGGFANFLQNTPVYDRGVKWRGTYSGAATYILYDGVWTGVGAARQFWVAKRTVTGVAPAQGADWEEITDDDDVGTSSWAPMPGLHICSYGLNDLGWAKDLPVFLSILRVIFGRMYASRVWEAGPIEGGLLDYSAAFGALADGNDIRYNSGSQYKVMSPLAIGQKVGLVTPPDWPGGKLRFGFIENASQARTTGKMVKVVDGVDGVVVDFTDAQRRSNTVGTASQKLAPWTADIDVPAGKHVVEMRVTEAFTPVPCGNYFDYISFDSTPLPPFVFVGLHKPVSYTTYTNPLPTDADVDVWNDAIEAMIAAEFPTGVFVRPEWPNDDREQYHVADLIHPNDRGHRVLAAQVLDAMEDSNITQDQANALAMEPRGGSSVVHTKWGNGVGGNITVATGGVWQSIAVNSITIEAFIVAQPGDLLRVTFNALWSQVNNNNFGYADIALVRAGLVTRYASSQKATQLTNGITSALSPPNAYNPVLPNSVFIRVEPEDLDNFSCVVVRPMLRCLYGGSGTDSARVILANAGQMVDLTVENLGPMDGIRTAGAL